MPKQNRSKWVYLLLAAIAATIALMLVPVSSPEFDEKYEPVGIGAGRRNLPPGYQEVLVHNRLKKPGTDAGPSREFFLLGTDQEGRSFAVVLLRGMQSSVKVALLGTLAVMVLAIGLGFFQGTTRSRNVERLLAASSLGLLALPEAAVLITLGNAWPRTAEPWRVNLSMVVVLIIFAVPTGARLIAERIRSVNRSGFVEASRGYGAPYLHTFRKDVLPHLGEDLSWIVATVVPRFIAVEIGLAYLGVEYRDFDGLGRALKKSFDYLSVQAAVLQLLATIIAVVWLALLPQAVSRLFRRPEGEEIETENSERAAAPKEQAENPLTGKSLRAPPPIPSHFLLSVQGLTVVDSTGREILRQLDIDLPRGKVVALVGESGSGKSTLLNCILNLLPDGLDAIAGAVLLAGKQDTDLIQLSIKERRRLDRYTFGYVPQDTRSALDPLAKAIDIVNEAAALVPDLVPDQTTRVRAAFAAAGLPTDFPANDANRRRGRLSGGQCQRVAIAQAIVNQPDLLLMDEPTSSLDPLARKGLLSTVMGLAAKGTTVLLVTHDIGSVADVADWVAVMYLGKVVECGPAAEVLHCPAHPYTKALVRCVPRVDGRFPLAVIPGEVAKDAGTISGCKFHPRCQECVDRCKVEEPESRAIKESVEVACHVA